MHTPLPCKSRSNRLGCPRESEEILVRNSSTLQAGTHPLQKVLLFPTRDRVSSLAVVINKVCNNNLLLFNFCFSLGKIMFCWDWITRLTSFCKEILMFRDHGDLFSSDFWQFINLYWLIVFLISFANQWHNFWSWVEHVRFVFLRPNPKICILL